MNRRCSNVIKIFRAINKMKSPDDKSLSIDAFLEQPACQIGDIALAEFDKEVLAASRSETPAQDGAAAFEEDISVYSDDDFIDPSQTQETKLTAQESEEIRQKFAEIKARLETALPKTDLRLYRSARPAFKKTLYNDLFDRYLKDYEYIPQNIRQELGAVVSIAVDKAFAAQLSKQSRVKTLFASLMNEAGSYIDAAVLSCKSSDENAVMRFGDNLYRMLAKRYVEPQRAAFHYTAYEYQLICQMTKKYIANRLKQNLT